jgi:hypothetical protein
MDRESYALPEIDPPARSRWRIKVKTKRGRKLFFVFPNEPGQGA